MRSSWCPKANVHIQGVSLGAALAWKMRPTTLPSASASKSSSFHCPEGRLADARLRISAVTELIPLLHQQPGALVAIEIECLNGGGFGGLQIGCFDVAEELAAAAHHDHAPAFQLGRGGPLSRGFLCGFHVGRYATT